MPGVNLLLVGSWRALGTSGGCWGPREVATDSMAGTLTIWYVKNAKPSSCLFPRSEVKKHDRASFLWCMLFWPTMCQAYGGLANWRAGGKSVIVIICVRCPSACLFGGTSVAASGEKLMPTALSKTVKGKGICWLTWQKCFSGIDAARSRGTVCTHVYTHVCFPACPLLADTLFGFP